MKYVSVLCAVLWVSMAVAQEDRDIVASKDGSFAPGAGLSAENDPDEIAALEQQAFREFRWDVIVPAMISLDFDIADAGEEGAEPPANATLVISTDRERFEPLAPDQLAVEGQVVAVLISQRREELDAGERFVPSQWSFRLSAQAMPAREDATVGPILLPIEFGEDLGCAVRGCGEEAFGTESTSVAGEPRSEAGTAPSTGGGSVSAEDRELARELQSELKRVGCYTIAVDGLWGPGSRRAMTAYNAAKGTELAVQSPTAKALVAVARETEVVCKE